MKKSMQTYSFFTFLLMILFSFNQNYITAQNSLSNDFAFQQNERLGRGVNIIGYDPIWNNSSQARFKETHFELIKNAGFNNVRIVIMPFKFSLKDENFTIDPKFFITLDWAINEALKSGLMAIVDFHEHNAMQKDPMGTKPMFLAMWKQIAEHCKHYNSNVLFEIANEPNMKPELWNEIHREAYTIIRASNPNRTLIIGTINGNQIKFLNDLELPENDRNIIVAIHYYMPIQFTHQGAPWSTKNKNLSGIEWTKTEVEEKEVQFDFEMAQKWSEIHNRPITLGEFGAYEKADMPSRVRWTNYIARQAEVRNWSWSYWQFDKDFVVYDIDNNEWVVPILDALIPKKNTSEITTPDPYKQNELLGRGINIPSIQNMEASHYKAIKEAGFNNVRIPIAPFNETLSKTDFTLKPSFFEMLDLAVKRALDNNLMPIIDFHQHHVIQNDPLGVAPAFYAIWQQIAEHYKDAPNNVLFEIANEPNVKPDLWNDFYKMAYRIIRKSNPNRTLLIGTIYGNQIKYLKDLELPENDRNIIVTIHYYEPIAFTHQGAEWNEKRKNVTGIQWPTEEMTEQSIIDDFKIAQDWSISNNRPLHLGEFGVYNKTDMAYRIKWTNFVAKQANKNNWSWSYWEFNQGFGIYNLKDNTWKEELLNALIPLKI